MAWICGLHPLPCAKPSYRKKTWYTRPDESNQVMCLILARGRFWANLRHKQYESRLNNIPSKLLCVVTQSILKLTVFQRFSNEPFFCQPTPNIFYILWYFCLAYTWKFPTRPFLQYCFWRRGNPDQSIVYQGHNHPLEFQQNSNPVFEQSEGGYPKVWFKRTSSNTK